MTTKRIIKKYSNRRLYDTQHKTYITFDDIKQLIFARVDFKIIDAKTQQDLTQSTLLQIILEEEATHNPIFSNDMLQDFIRFYHDKSQNMFGDYLEKAMQLFHQQKDFYKSQWQTYSQEALNMQNLWPMNLSRTAKKTKVTPKKAKKRSP